MKQDKLNEIFTFIDDSKHQIYDNINLTPSEEAIISGIIFKLCKAIKNIK